MTLNLNSKLTFQKRFATPPATPKVLAQAPPERDLSDAFVKNEQTRFGLGRLALLGLGAAAAVTTVAQAEPAAIQDVDLAQDEITSVAVDLRQTGKLLGGSRGSGRVGEQENFLETTTRFLGGDQIEGTWNGQQVDLDMNSGFFGGYDIKGRWGENNVDLKIRSSWDDYQVTGQWGDEAVRARFDLDWSGNFDVDGSWRGEEIDLNISSGFIGSKITGEYGDQEVRLGASGQLFGIRDIEGESPEEAVFPLLLSNRLSEIRAQSLESD